MTRKATMTTTNREEHDLSVKFGPSALTARMELMDEYVATLALPPDDMWWAFAQRADPVALYDGQERIGFAAIDGDGELHRFFVRSGHEQRGAALVDLIDEQRSVVSMIAATTDPVALTALLPLARSHIAVAMLYHHETEPADVVLDEFVLATNGDHGRVLSFVADSTGGPQAFLDGYVRERIERKELFLHHAGGELAGIGERRFAEPGAGHAHLGIIVGQAHRSRGLGGALMNTLVRMCEREQLTPLCSTEPDNVAAQRLIHRAGFRSRHTIFRMEPAHAGGAPS